MGAHSIEVTAPKRLTEKQIEKLFKQTQKEDRLENGHRHGYSGDFQTVGRVEYHDKVFLDTMEAMDYCLEHAEKWDSVIAVHWVRDYKESSKLLSLKKREEKLKKELLETQKKVLMEVEKCKERAKKVKKYQGTIIAGWGAC